MVLVRKFFWDAKDEAQWHGRLERSGGHRYKLVGHGWSEDGQRVALVIFAGKAVDRWLC